MAQQCRIDSLVVNADGSIACQYTVGEYPLPASPSGQGANWGSVTDLLDAIAAVEAQLTGDAFVPLTLAAGLKADPTLSDPGAFAGHSLIIDLTSPSNPFTQG